MTREEAYQKFSEWRNLGFGHSTMPGSEVLVMAMKSLRPITREQVEKMRGEWMFSIFEGQVDANDPRLQCSECGSIETPLATHQFCPRCGAPMTDEAVDILWKRLEAMRDG